MVTLLGVVATAQQAEQPIAKLTVRVVDEQGQPVNDAAVRIAFSEKFSRDQAMLRGTTNAQGELIQEGHSDAIWERTLVKMAFIFPDRNVSFLKMRLRGVNIRVATGGPRPGAFL